MASRKRIESAHVVHLHFAGTRRVEVLQPSRSEKPAVRLVPSSRCAGVPRADTLAAVARLVAENAGAGTVDGDLEVICRLLRQKCAWSDESLFRLRRTVATALDLRRRHS